MRKLLLGFLSLLMLGQFAMALPAGAQLSANQEAVQLLQQTGLGGATSPDQAGKMLPILIGRIVRVLISLLGVIFLILIVYAGFLWMTARGESEAVEKAKNILRQSIIGLIIILLAYALTGFIITSVIQATAA